MYTYYTTQHFHCYERDVKKFIHSKNLYSNIHRSFIHEGQELRAT